MIYPDAGRDLFEQRENYFFTASDDPDCFDALSPRAAPPAGAASQHRTDGIPAGGFADGVRDTREGTVYYVIHPVLKHLARRQCGLIPPPAAANPLLSGGKAARR